MRCNFKKEEKISEVRCMQGLSLHKMLASNMQMCMLLRSVLGILHGEGHGPKKVENHWSS